MNKDILVQKTGINLDEVRELFSDETLNSFELQSLRGGAVGDKIECSNTDCIVKGFLCDFKVFCGSDSKKDSICKAEPIKDSVCK